MKDQTEAEGRWTVSRPVRLWRINELYGGDVGASILPNVAPYRARIGLWENAAIGDIFFHEPTELVKHPVDTVSSAGFLRMHMPVSMLDTMISLLRGTELVRVGYFDGHGWISTNDQNESVSSTNHNNEC